MGKHSSTKGVKMLSQSTFQMLAPRQDDFRNFCLSDELDARVRERALIAT